ncbi:MAG: hypothetical protein GXX84_09805 [Acidobacteria bacterium]|nr:hypothetical protein [Acidobacteriota bacterium]
MFRLFTSTIALFLGITVLTATAAASEDAKSRPDENEIMEAMKKAAGMPAERQSELVNTIAKRLSSSTTPRSDFMSCTGLAYLGNPIAQKCLAVAYEQGIGIVQDPMEAYVWYAIAQQNTPGESFPEVERLKLELVANYPAPSEEELEEMVQSQKARIAQYQKEGGKTAR